MPLHRHRPGPRRLLSAGLVAAAVAAGLQVLAPAPPPGSPVVVATRALSAGARVRAGDVSVRPWAPAQVPSGALTDARQAVGRAAAGPLSPGEAVTPGRLVGPDLLAGRPDGEVLAPVRLADPAVADLLTVGQRVDVLVAVEGAGQARAVARAATVLGRAGRASDQLGGLDGSGGLALPPGPASGDAIGSQQSTGGGLVLLAVPEATAAALVQAASQGPLSVVIY